MLSIRAELPFRFAEHGVPQLLERTIDRTAQQPAWPELPATYAENSADLWPALRDAVATTDREPTGMR